MSDTETGPIGPSIDYAEVLRRIPHRYPRLLVDRAEDYRPHERIIGIKNVSFNEPFFQGHFPGVPVMPGVLIMEALAQTGGTITSCGLIMAGTFATLLMAGLNTLVQVGFALAFGVLLDTFLVRPVLVPAFAMWWWRREGEPRSEAWR